MALFNDRDYGRNWNRGYDRGYGNQSGWGAFGGGYDSNRGRFDRSEYDSGYNGSWNRGSRMGGDRYDTGYKSRWQTDYGDPFNDRGSHTPIRMTRGEFRGSGNRERGWGSNYDRNYSTNPMGYDPYGDQSDRSFFGSPRNRYDRGFRGRGGRGGYDRGWF